MRCTTISAFAFAVALAAGGLAWLLVSGAGAIWADEKPGQRATLTFRIVANDKDDEAGLKAARQFFADAARDARMREQLDRLAGQGKPPPRPGAGKRFKTPLGEYGYSWFELSQPYRRELNLDNAAGEDAQRNALWKLVAQARDKGEPISLREAVEKGATGHLMNGLLYSRPCTDGRLSAAERKEKKFDYFLLLRDPAEGKGITGDDLEKAEDTVDAQDHPAVHIRLTKEGGDRFYELTSRNGPTGGADNPFRRHLAVVLDDQVLTAPRLLGAIRREAAITGRFTRPEVERFAARLRSGIAGKKK